jgi:hypothetical protein
MKKYRMSFACASFLTIVAAAASIASTPEQAAGDQHLQCAIYNRDAHAKPGALRVCEAYWANDTAEDERELAEAASSVSVAATTPSAPSNR